MLTILFIHLVGLASPGPDFFYVVKQSASQSPRAGILAAIGISLGIFFWAGISIFGLVWLKHHIGLLFQYIIMLIGGCYLSYIGIKMVRITKNAVFNNIDGHLHAIDTFSEIRKGLMINIFNAKAAVYFTSVVSKFLDDFTETYQLFLLLFLFVISTFIYFYLVALLFSRQPIRKLYSQYSRYIDNIAGIIFIFFGLTLIHEAIIYFI